MKATDPEQMHASPAVAGAVRHALVWLVVGNAIGVLIAVLLLAPGLNIWLGEWTYGRWMMVHMNVLLFGWCSLPLLGFLFRVYGTEHGATARWCRPVLWVWSSALTIGSASWLAGHSSGKLFLDWTGYARSFFPLAMGTLWIVLAFGYYSHSRSQNRVPPAARLFKLAGLALLLVVPFTIYFASNPNVYPAVNPDTGGPTGASQLDSSLGIVLILLLLPFGITRRNQRRTGVVPGAWIALVAEGLWCASLSRADLSHHLPVQYLSLGALLIWIPLIPAYYRAFEWLPATRLWRRAMFWWWGGLVLTGWAFFLPGVLDRFKFTDALVGHSLTAVAGFLTALLMLMMVQLLGEHDAWVLNRKWSFFAWNHAVLTYIVIITIAGCFEASDPAFTIVPGLARNLLYIIRLLTGLSMLAASIEWLAASSSLRTLPRELETRISELEAA